MFIHLRRRIGAAGKRSSSGGRLRRDGAEGSAAAAQPACVRRGLLLLLLLRSGLGGRARAHGQQGVSGEDGGQVCAAQRVHVARTCLEGAAGLNLWTRSSRRCCMATCSHAVCRAVQDSHSTPRAPHQAHHTTPSRARARAGAMLTLEVVRLRRAAALPVALQGDDGQEDDQLVHSILLACLGWGMREEAWARVGAVPRAVPAAATMCCRTIQSFPHAMLQCRSAPGAPPPPRARTHPRSSAGRSQR